MQTESITTLCETLEHERAMSARDLNAATGLADEYKDLADEYKAALDLERCLAAELDAENERLRSKLIDARNELDALREDNAGMRDELNSMFDAA